MPYVIVCDKTDHGAVIVAYPASSNPMTFPNKESAEAWIAERPHFSDCVVKLQEKVCG